MFTQICVKCPFCSAYTCTRAGWSCPDQTQWHCSWQCQAGLQQEFAVLHASAAECLPRGSLAHLSATLTELSCAALVIVIVLSLHDRPSPTRCSWIITTHSGSRARMLLQRHLSSFICRRHQPRQREAALGLGTSSLQVRHPMCEAFTHLQSPKPSRSQKTHDLTVHK